MTQPLAAPARGPAGLRQLFTPLFEAMPDLRVDVMRWGATDDGALIEIRLHGTLGGRPLAWTAVDRFVLRDGQIAERHSYFDPLPLVRAMALAPAGEREAGASADRGKEAAMSTAEQAAWRSPAWARAASSTCLRAGLTVFEAGTGPPIVFVHGLLVNANLWRKVVARLVARLPLHRARPAARLAPRARCGPTRTSRPYGLADLIADAIEALGLDDVTLVGNDTGGALCQIVVTRRPERIGRLVLTSCDYRDNFPPPMFAYFKPVGAHPGRAQGDAGADALAGAAPSAVRVRLARQAPDRSRRGGLLRVPGHGRARAWRTT